MNRNVADGKGELGGIVIAGAEFAVQGPGSGRRRGLQGTGLGHGSREAGGVTVPGVVGTWRGTPDTADMLLPYGPECSGRGYWIGMVQMGRGG